jgi:hypothetical protein
MSVFDYLTQHPEEASLFSDTMIGLHQQEPPEVEAAYDFWRSSPFSTLVFPPERARIFSCTSFITGEDQCPTIMSHVRNAMHPASCLVVVERVLAAGDAPHPGKMLEMLMLAQLGGQERT